MLNIVDLKCENLTNPIGMDEKNPIFSWKLESDKENTVQTRYELTVGNFTVNESCGDSINIEYTGPALRAKTKYPYSVTVWDNHGEVSYAEGYFVTGYMGKEPNAKWIARPGDVRPVFVKEFEFDGEDAYITASCYGLFEILINGKAITDTLLNPGFTSYLKRIQYRMFDVRDYLTKGTNKIEIYIGKGWCKGRFPAFVTVPSPFIEMPNCVFCELISGGKTVVATDDTWLSYQSPVIMSEIYDGETFDARLEGKYENEFPAVEYDIGFGNLVSSRSVPVKVIKTIKPLKMFTTPKGETVLDFGQNIAGWIKFSIKGKEGDVIKYTHAEVLDADGNFYTDNMRSAKNEIFYTFKGEGVETYRPWFTFQGFRYVRLDECTPNVTADNFVAEAISSDTNVNGHIECSDAMVNQLFSNILWSQRDNFVDIPTDCPQRDERLGWTGDAQVFISTALKNADCSAFFTKWLLDMMADQKKDGMVGNYIPLMTCLKTSSGWGDAGVVCPWELYKAYGNKKFLATTYPMSKKWIEYIKAQGENPYLWNTGFQYGDWLGLDAKPGSYEGSTDKTYIATVFFAYSTYLTGKMAEVLGYEEDVKYLSELYANIVDAFRKEYVGDDGEPKCKTQTAYVLGLYMNLFEDMQKNADALNNMILANGTKLQTGFIGTPYLCYALSRYGHTDTAYGLLLQKEYPSWLFSVRQGATTIWEHWDGIREDGTMWSTAMNSFNHYAYGSVADWIYSEAMGVTPIEAGYKKIKIAPIPSDALGYMEARFNTPHGFVGSKWEHKDGKTIYTVEIPCNTTAEVVLPNGNVHNVGSGVYTFEG